MLRSVVGYGVKHKNLIFGGIPNHYFLTVSVTVVLCCKLPLVPAMVSVNVPLALPAVTVIVVVPDPVTEVGLKLALAPPGNPAQLNVTTPVNPFNGVTVTV
jgi:hypothetical protein